jgi:peptide chain release factor 2
MPRPSSLRIKSRRIDCRSCAVVSTSSGGVFDTAGLRERLSELEQRSGDPSLWDDREQAEKVLRDKAALERQVTLFDDLGTALDDGEVLIELGAEADDDDTRREAAAKLDGVERDLDTAELARLLSGEHDASNAIVSINSGAGGTDAADWAEMLMRMFTRWSERHEYGVEILDVQVGDEAGLRSATFTVRGSAPHRLCERERGPRDRRQHRGRHR